jgi:Bacterial Ig-like domain (group 2)
MMSSIKRNLRVTGAFAALATLALAVSCRGFFVNPTLTSIAIAPASPQVEVGTTLTPALQVFGTYSDGSNSVVTSGVSWTSQTPSVATITAGGVLQGISIGTSTIQASAQAVTASATATVFLGGISQITVSPTNQSITASATTAEPFNFVATANGTQYPITTDNGGVLTITPTTSDLTCEASGNGEICSGDGNEALQTYSLVMSYPGTTQTATATLSVSQ